VSRSFAALCGKLSPDEASTLTSPLASRIVEWVVKDADLASRLVEPPAKDADPHNPLEPMGAFAALASNLNAGVARKLASALASRISELAAKTSDVAKLLTLSETFALLPDKLPKPDAARHAFQIAKHLARTIHQARASDSKPPCDALARLAVLLDTESLLHLLKQPGCTEAGRAVLLTQLGKRFNRKFHTIWDLVDHLERLDLGNALSSPLFRQPHTPLASE
jgi:hypothetical protein